MKAGISFVSLLCLLELVSSLQVLHTFRDPEDHSFQRLAVHYSTGAVYIGATNRIHRLTANLSLIQSAATGPRMDNPECPPPIMPCGKPKTPLDSLVKGLVIDSDNDAVILCTSLFHGSCQVLKLSNITSMSSYTQKPVVPNDESSCVMFLAPGAMQEPSLYIGAEYSSLGDEAYRDLVPSISSRRLNTLELVHRDSQGGTRMAVKPELRAEFKIKFISGFSYQGYVYFITTQPKSPKSKEMASRISRLCAGDRYFRSYIEIPLECQDGLSANPVVAQAASRMDDDGLVVSFSPDSSSGSGASALCLYRMENIDKAFADTIENCYNGQGKVGPAHYETERTCVRAVSTDTITT